MKSIRKCRIYSFLVEAFPILVLLFVIVYPLLHWHRLPSSIAVHVGWGGYPDGWMSKSGEYALFTVLVLIFWCITLGINRLWIKEDGKAWSFFVPIWHSGLFLLGYGQFLIVNFNVASEREVFNFHWGWLVSGFLGSAILGALLEMVRVQNTKP